MADQVRDRVLELIEQDPAIRAEIADIVKRVLRALAEKPEPKADKSRETGRIHTARGSRRGFVPPWLIR